MEEKTTRDVFEAFEKALKAYNERRSREIKNIREEFIAHYYKMRFEEDAVKEEIV